MLIDARWEIPAVRFGTTRSALPAAERGRSGHMYEQHVLYVEKEKNSWGQTFICGQITSEAAGCIHYEIIPCMSNAHVDVYIYSHLILKQ